MPGLAQRGEREPEDVGGLIVGVEAALAEEVTHRVDAPGDVVDEEHSHQSAPEVAGDRTDPTAGDRVPERRRDQQADYDQGDEVTGDEAHAVVLVEVTGVFLPVGASLRLHQPTGVGVPETADPLPVTDVRTGW